jgi:hypothetical protein
MPPITVEPERPVDTVRGLEAWAQWAETMLLKKAEQEQNNQ